MNQILVSYNELLSSVTNSLLKINNCIDSFVDDGFVSTEEVDFCIYMNLNNIDVISSCCLQLKHYLFTDENTREIFTNELIRIRNLYTELFNKNRCININGNDLQNVDDLVHTLLEQPIKNICADVIDVDFNYTIH